MRLNEWLENQQAYEARDEFEDDPGFDDDDLEAPDEFDEITVDVAVEDDDDLESDLDDDDYDDYDEEDDEDYEY